MRSLGRIPLHRAMSWLVIGTLGAFESVYGRTQYLGDWICYLNVSRAVSALDWKAIFDPMWSPGYPVLIALARAAFPHTPEGEWHAISLLNWLIFLGAYAAWKYLVRQAIDDRPVFAWMSTCAFLSCALCLDRVSNVCPDLLITTLFVLAMAQVLSIIKSPRISKAVWLGVILGAGYWIKGVFLPFALIFLLILLVASLSQISLRSFLVAAAVFLAMATPFVIGVSKSYGNFTIGVSGSLNYAFHVNHVPHWTNWQGSPLHRTNQLVTDLPVFGFGAPFQTTYPPYNNMAYWYQGLKSSFSLKSQFVATVRNLYFLAGVVKRNPFLCALVLALLGITLKREWRTGWKFWPLFVPAIIGLGLYLLVHIEDRYVSPCGLVLSLLPLISLLDRERRSRETLAVLLLVLYTGGTAAQLIASHRDTFRAAIHRDDLHSDPQWKLAVALPSYGLRPGDAIALIDEKSPAYRCHWAYVTDLKIVAELGSLPWTTEPWDRTRFDHIAEPADQDYALLFWSKLAPEKRAEVVDAFRSTGARAVLSLSKPDFAPEPGWEEIAGTSAWIYRFDSDTASASGRR